VEVQVSAQYLVFVSAYALTLVVASLLVFTLRGQALLLRWMEGLGHRFGVGPWGLLHTFGHEATTRGLDAAGRAALAESYIASAEEQTLHGARVATWVMIAGCLACAVAALIIIGVLPPLVLSGAWPYERYRGAAMLVVDGTAGGGLVVGLGLVAWLSRRIVALNRADGCAVARDLVFSARDEGIAPDLAAELQTGSYPRLSRLLGHVPA
jgi:hypothetical protein